MHYERAERILKALEALGAEQMLITDPMSIYYLTDVYVQPFERFFGLLLRTDGHHILFLNRLFHVPQDVGIEKIWYSDTDPVTDIIAQYLDASKLLAVDKDLKAIDFECGDFAKIKELVKEAAELVKEIRG